MEGKNGRDFIKRVEEQVRKVAEEREGRKG